MNLNSHTLYMRTWRKTHAAQARENERKYRETHKEQVRINKHRRYEENKEQVRNANHSWSKAHPEKMTEYRLKWRREHPDQEKECKRKWRESNPESNREWRIANPERTRSYNQLKRARKRDSAFEKFIAIEIYERDNWICGLCRRKVDKKLRYPNGMSKSLDHIIPLSKGGAHIKTNVQLAHLECNVRAGVGGIKQLRLF